MPRIFQTVLNDSLAKQLMAQMAAHTTLPKASRAWCNEPGTPSHYWFPCRGKDYSSIFSLKSGALAWQYSSKMQKTAHVGRRVRRVRYGTGCEEKGKRKKQKEGRKNKASHTHTLGTHFCQDILVVSPRTWDRQPSPHQEAKKPR